MLLYNFFTTLIVNLSRTVIQHALFWIGAQNNPSDGNSVTWFSLHVACHKYQKFATILTKPKLFFLENVAKLLDIDSFFFMLAWVKFKLGLNLTCSTRQIFIGPLGVADFLYNLITRYGVAKIVMSDQGQEFINRVNEEQFKLCGTDHRISVVYHPHGHDEIMNQTLT